MLRHRLSRFPALALAFLSAMLGASCAPASDGNDTVAGGSGAPVAAAGATSAGHGGVANNDTAGTAGSAPAAGAATVAGASALGGGSGMAGGAGGTAGGQAGASGGGGGGGDAAEDPRMAAQVLDGFSLLKPCVSSFKPSGNSNNAGDCCCEELAANENQHVTKQFGGDANHDYSVKIRIAGVAERYWYADGQLDTASKLFYTGGLPTIHSDKAPNTNLSPGQGACKIHPPETDSQFKLPFTVPDEIRPEDGCYNGFNIFAMTVSSPKGKQSYYLNYTTDFDGADRQPHSVYKNDYTVTITIPGQAQLDFYTIDGDHHQVTNNGTMSVPNLKTPQPYNGNFLEFAVLEVAVAN
jgi:hypothetical protein